MLAWPLSTMALRHRPGHQSLPQRRQHYTDFVAAALADSMRKPLPWAVGFFFGNLELSMELWTVIAGISGFDE